MLTCKGWRSKSGECIERCRDMEDGVWPIEFQNPDWYSRAGTIEHYHIRDLPQLLQAGDALVVNDTRVLPARLVATAAAAVSSNSLMFCSCAASAKCSSATAGVPF